MPGRSILLQLVNKLFDFMPLTRGYGKGVHVSAFESIQGILGVALQYVFAQQMTALASSTPLFRGEP